VRGLRLATPRTRRVHRHCAHASRSRSAGWRAPTPPAMVRILALPVFSPGSYRSE
jgi:hypothetical protein